MDLCTAQRTINHSYGYDDSKNMKHNKVYFIFVTRNLNNYIYRYYGDNS